MSVLAAILESKRRDIEALRRGAHADAPHASRTPIDVAAALRRSRGAPLRLIAEVKMKSPSAGDLSRALDAPSRAAAYDAAGATMVSVLCDGPFFAGGWNDLAAARTRLDEMRGRAALLAKEFVLDESQIDCARRHGADAVLLIARIVDAPRLAMLVRAARAHRLEPFVEISDENELTAALAVDARVIGVNARDLDTLVIDTARTARVLSAIPADRVAVHLSGLKSEADVAAVARGNAHAALLGEVLMRQDDPRDLLARFVTAAKT